MSETALAVEIREQSGKGVARKLRAADRVPAVLYGRGRDAVALVLDPHALGKLISGHSGMNTLIDLEGPGSVAGRTVLVKDLQRDPVRGSILHADLYEVDLKQTVEVAVPIHVSGTATGVSLGGGILDQSLREIELSCLPRAIPDEIAVDVTPLEVGDVLHVRDLTLPEGVELISDGDLAVLQVVMPAAEEVEAPAEAEEGAEAPAEAAAAEGEEPKAEEASGD